MGVRADDHHARSDEPLFRQDDVLDARTTYLEVILNVMLFGKIADDLRQSGGFDILIRREMVRDERDLRAVEDRAADLFKFLDGRRRGDVIGHHQIQLAVDQVARLDRVLPCMGRHNFLRHCHSHE